MFSSRRPLPPGPYSESRTRPLRDIYFATMQPLYFVASVLAASITTVTAGIAARATAGCGKVHLLPGITTYHGLTSSGRDRTYSVHLPSGYDRSKPYPVVLGFHGSSSIGFFFEADTRLSESRFSATVCCLILKYRRTSA